MSTVFWLYLIAKRTIFRFRNIYIDTHFTIRFVDSYRFMVSKLGTLAKNLVIEDFGKFGETSKVFSLEDIPLVTRKGVYPYEYTDEWQKLCETSLPTRTDFYSTLLETHVDVDDYEHAQRVWDHFGCRTLGDYSDLYLKIEVLLLAISLLFNYIISRPPDSRLIVCSNILALNSNWSVTMINC